MSLETTAERLATLAAALERRSFTRAAELAASLGNVRGPGTLADVAGPLRLGLVALVVAIEGLALELSQARREEERTTRVNATAAAAREVARAMREIGSLDVEDVRRLDSMADADLLRLSYLVEQRLEASAEARGRRVVAALERQRRTPEHRLLGVLVAHAVEAWDLTQREIERGAVHNESTLRHAFKGHVRERLSQPIGAAALEVEVDLLSAEPRGARNGPLGALRSHRRLHDALRSPRGSRRPARRRRLGRLIAPPHLYGQIRPRPGASSLAAASSRR